MYSKSADIFALGTLLYEMGTGEDPFNGSGRSAISSYIDSVMNKDVNPLPGKSDQFNQLMLLCLNKNVV